ncbi:MAG: hypothetical protein AAFX99_25145 [Myxococcota bacterium]
MHWRSWHMLVWIGMMVGCGVPETGTFLPESAANVQARTGGQPGDFECTQTLDCGQGQVCCSGACVEPDACRGALCERQGARCRLDPTLGIDEQENFVCARLDQEQTDGTCLGRCDETYSPGGCTSASYCLPVTVADQSQALCLPSECSTDSACSWIGPYGGTCIPFGNLSGFCFSAGTVPQGQSCEASPRQIEGLCESGLYCSQSRTEDTGRCQPLCNMWLGSDECPAGTSCGFLTRGAGVCSVSTRMGDVPFEPCEPAFGWCDDGVECLDFGTGGESLPVCSVYCRPQVPGDCSGSRFGDRQATCRPVFSNGQGELIEDLGLCF